MYKNLMFKYPEREQDFCFNPCFNGTMYKNGDITADLAFGASFNPCFNGTMYKNPEENDGVKIEQFQSLLMELCIKT